MLDRLRPDQQQLAEKYDIRYFDAPKTSPKLTPATLLLLRQAMAQGHYPNTACQYAGVRWPTVKAWIALGRDEEARGITSPYTILLEQIEEGQLECEARLEASSYQAAQTDGRHALEVLSRMNPQRWGRKDQRQVSGSVDIALELKRLITRDGPQSEEILIGPGNTVYQPLSGDRLRPGSLRALPGSEAGAGRAIPGADSDPGAPGAAEEGAALDID